MQLYQSHRKMSPETNKKEWSWWLWRKLVNIKMNEKKWDVREKKIISEWAGERGDMSN